MDAQMAMELGRGLTIAGALVAAGLGCCGSGRGIGIASQAAAGVLSEKPDLFGRMLVMIALPGTQGFYAFITSIMIFMKTGLNTGEASISLGTGIGLLFLGIAVGTAQYVTAVWQGQASAAGIALIGRRPGESGRALLFPALVETYAVVALLIGILVIFWVTA